MNAGTVMGAGQWVVLAGGPSEMARVRQLPAGGGGNSTRIAVPFYGQHQHFEHTGETEVVEGRQVPVFRWTYSTAIAE
ncbi:DUF5988 family protein [Streptomyces syringium]|uniref:DUF5988 family protein n=1 Tax=Streptomyces syringium TaxID=76729 RepID=UPI0034555B54